MMKRATIVLALASCSGPSTTDDGGGPDAAIAVAIGWGAPMQVMLDKPAGGFATDPSFTEDQARVVYAVTSIGSSDYDLYEAMMTSKTAGGARRPVLARPGIVESSPEISPDGLALHFLTFEGMMGRIDRTTRTGLSRPWAMPTTPAELNSPADERPGNVDRAKTRIVIARGPVLVELAESGGTWSEQATTAALPMMARDPHLSADALTLVFTAPDDKSSTDLYVSVRDAVETPWSAPHQMQGVSDSEMPEQDPWLAADGKRLYFTRGATIFMAER